MTTALVTGATAGIGVAFVRRLAAEGHDLVLVARDERRLEQEASDVRRLYAVGVEVLVADLADRDGCASVERRLQDPGAPVDLLVNNAGFGLGRSFLETDADDEERMLDVMVRAVMRLTHAAVGPMVERGVGAIVTVSSLAAYVPNGTYSAAKAWQASFTESLAVELRDTGVRVLGVYPGYTRTEFHARADIDMSALPDFLWLDADEVAHKALDDLNAGRTASVAGASYRAVAGLTRALPRPVARRLAERKPGRSTSSGHDGRTSRR
jgi:short-subunit dehydrogenase